TSRQSRPSPPVPRRRRSRSRSAQRWPAPGPTPRPRSLVRPPWTSTGGAYSRSGSLHATPARLSGSTSPCATGRSAQSSPTQVSLFVYRSVVKGAPSGSLVFPSQTVEVIVEMAATAFVATVLGLLISALAKTTEQTTPIMVVVVMAMLALSGGLFQLQGNKVM